jgi:hypothetical protein
VSQTLRAGTAAAPRSALLDLSSDPLDRLFASFPAPPWVLGGAIAVALSALYGAATLLSGELEAFLSRGGHLLTDRNARLGVALPILVAYAPTAQRVLALASRRNLAALARATGTPTPPLEPLGHKALVTALFLLFLPLTALAVDRDPLLYFRAHYWTGASAGNWIVGALLCAGLGRFAHATLGWSRAFRRAAPAAAEVDLFDRGWLAPFASEALLCALLWLLVPTLFAVNLGDAPFVLVFLPVALGCVAIGFAALWLPTSGVRQRLLEAKRAELLRVHAALRGERGAAGTLAVARRAPEPSLADLLAYERFLQGLPTTPFDQANRIRFALYLALPLGSWLGGALVERAIGLLLD